jgi:hypothetical protein
MDIWTPLERLDVAANFAAAQLCYGLGGDLRNTIGLMLAAVVTGWMWRRAARLGRVLLVILWCLILITLITASARAQERVDSNVITALDVSSSINAVETQLQIDGLAAAVRSPAFVAAIQQGRAKRIGFTAFLWADGEYPEILGWRAIGSQEEAEAAAAEIAAQLAAILADTSRSVGTLTDLSGALDHAGALLAAAPFSAGRGIVNVVGNGEDNVGENPQRARAALLAAGVTINGVIVGGDQAVIGYFRKNVIGGRGAFVLSAARPDDLVTVFLSKFVTEIAFAETVPR